MRYRSSSRISGRQKLDANALPWDTLILTTTSSGVPVPYILVGHSTLARKLQISRDTELRTSKPWIHPFLVVIASVNSPRFGTPLRRDAALSISRWLVSPIPLSLSSKYFCVIELISLSNLISELGARSCCLILICFAFYRFECVRVQEKLIQNFYQNMSMWWRFSLSKVAVFRVEFQERTVTRPRLLFCHTCSESHWNGPKGM